MTKSYQYQQDFARAHATELYNAEKRAAKARKTLAVLADHAARHRGDMARQSLLDIGASAGFLTKAYAQYFGRVVGLDIDTDAIGYAQAHNAAENLRFIRGDSMSLPFAENSFDVVTCSQVYEHVPDAHQLLAEIYRVLKPGGVCYFAAGNRFVLVEMHYNLPLLSAIPKPLAHVYLRLTGRGRHYYENHLSLWGLRRLVRDFEVTDYTLDIIRDPSRFALTDLVAPNSVKQRLALSLLPRIYWLCPTYIWLLKKPASGAL